MAVQKALVFWFPPCKELIDFQMIMVFTLESQTPCIQPLAHPKPSQSHEYQMAKIPPLWLVPLKGSSLSPKMLNELIGSFLVLHAGL